MTAHDTNFLYNPLTRARVRVHTHTEQAYMGKCRHVPSLVSCDTLAALAQRVVRLCPDHRNPERFHEDKSEIAAELRRLARLTGMTPL